VSKGFRGGVKEGKIRAITLETRGSLHKTSSRGPAELSHFGIGAPARARGPAVEDSTKSGRQEGNKQHLLGDDGEEEKKRSRGSVWGGMLTSQTSS